MLIRATATRFCAGLVAVALAACSSKQPSHHWEVYNESYIAPAERLREVPRIVLDERPPELVSFVANADPDYEKNRASASDAAAATGAGAMFTSGQSAVLCILLLPLCVPVILAGAATGAAVGAVRQGTSSVTDEQAGRLAEAVKTADLNAKLADWADRKIGAAPRPTDYPRFVLRVVGVAMFPTASGLTFRVAAEAQSFPAAGEMSAPTVHYIELPSRTASEWLGWGADGGKLKHDLNSALKVLAFRIMPIYLPEKPTGS